MSKEVKLKILDECHVNDILLMIKLENPEKDKKEKNAEEEDETNLGTMNADRGLNLV